MFEFKDLSTRMSSVPEEKMRKFSIKKFKDLRHTNKMCFLNSN
jgi:hypothetical protein